MTSKTFEVSRDPDLGEVRFAAQNLSYADALLRAGELSIAHPDRRYFVAARRRKPS